MDGLVADQWREALIWRERVRACTGLATLKKVRESTFSTICQGTPTPDTRMPKAVIALPEFSELLRALYSGTLEETPWQTFLASLRQLLGADTAFILLRRPSEDDRGVILSDSRARSFESAENPYTSGFYAQDPFVNLPADAVVTLDEYVGTQTLLDSEFYRVCLEPFDIFHILGVDMVLDEGTKASLRASRSRKAQPFTRPEKELCRLLTPHLKQAISIHARIERIESERTLFAGAMTQLALATIILDEKGDILQTNPIADELLVQLDGLRIIDGKLSINRSADNLRLRELVADATAAQRQGQSSIAQAMSVERPSGRAPLGLVVRPVPAREWAEGQQAPCVGIFISDPEQRASAPKERLVELFGLTPAESGLAIALANGLTLDEATAELGISRNTGRAHLRSIFAKTGMTQQTKLVRLILQSVANLG